MTTAEQSSPSSTQALLSLPPGNDLLNDLIQEAIRSGRFDQAHRLLLSLVRADATNAQLWLLLAWTAPTHALARVFFKHLIDLEPAHPLALDGLSWSEVEWARLRNEHGNGSQPAAHQAAPAIVQAAIPPVEPARAYELPVAAPMLPPLPARDELGSAAPPRMQARGFGYLGFGVYLILYILGIAAAEAVTSFLNPQFGLVIHGGLLVLILLHASIGAEDEEQKFLFALALAPLIRLLSLSMPLLQFQFSYWYMVIGAPLLLSALLVLRLTGYKPSQVGLTLGKGLPLQIVVAFTGLGLGYLEYQILKPEPLVESFSLQNIWLPALILLVFTGFLEELIFRGLMQRAALATIKKLGPLYISLLFAVLHIGYRSLTDFVFVFLVGLFFSLVVGRTRSILGVTLAHGITNIALFLIFPFVTIP